jgi:hypothetical protein
MKKITYDEIRTAMKGKPYGMTLAGNDVGVVVGVVDVGIDAHLEACHVPDRGDSYRPAGGKLVCRVSPDSLPVLVRRLCESDNDVANDLGTAILETLSFRVETGSFEVVQELKKPDPKPPKKGTPDINKILARPENVRSSRYGAAMGRMDQAKGDPSEKLYIQRLKWEDGDYDTGGAYWGGGVGDMYCAFSPEDTKDERPIRIFVRATSLHRAKEKAIEVLEEANGESGWSFYE